MEKFIPYEKLCYTQKSEPQSLQQEKDTEMDGGSICRVFFYMKKRYPPAAGRGISKE